MAYQQNFQTEIEYLKGVGPFRAEVLKKELGIFTFYDLLNYFPFRYVDRTKLWKISEINNDLAYIQLKGTVTHLQEIGEKRGKRLVANFSDGTGQIELVWFRGIKWIKEYIKSGQEYLIFGKPSIFKNTFNIVHPEMELLKEAAEITNTIKIQPVYSSTEKLGGKGLESKGIMKLERELLRNISNQINEVLPESIVKSFRFISRIEAYNNIHFPESFEKLEQAKNRLKFEELFFLQLELLKTKWKREQRGNGFVFSKVGELFNKFYNEVLPFSLTEAQKRVIREIRLDMKSGRQMNRLLQGDVGSGKTIVALMSMLIAIENGYQACIMAPTEILAQQHYKTISCLMEPLNLKVGILTGSSKSAHRKNLDKLLLSGDINILIGTHAIIEDVVQFNSLGLVIIDEQHRFGVAQRAKLWKKSVNPPHVLVMTATPIPRTLAMTVYGDLDVSVIDELPPGRKPIITKWYGDDKRLKVWGGIRQEIARGKQVYVVYPLIEESEKLDYLNLMDGYDNICRAFPPPDYHIGIMHGRMKADVKDFEMNHFKSGEYHILVATNVIEVGVDVPNASVMVIESAERFGLSQLHQLRGRVGRGAEQSWCILMTSNKLSNEAMKRMQTMEYTNDGFKIAEVDMTIRGPGDIAGTQQSGIVSFHLANLATDHQMVKAARISASNLIDEDPFLKKAENQPLKSYLISYYSKDVVNWSEIS